jgi:hypothetical protein
MVLTREKTVMTSTAPSGGGCDQAPAANFRRMELSIGNEPGNSSF